MIEINESRCPKDHPCPVTRVCPTGAISQESPFKAPKIDAEKCVNCGRCTKVCPYGAFRYK